MTYKINWDELDDLKFLSESEAVIALSDSLESYDSAFSLQVEDTARQLIARARDSRTNISLVSSILSKIPLSSSEGRALMRICESLHRSNGADQHTLINEQFNKGDWKSLVSSKSPAVKVIGNASRVIKKTGSNKIIRGSIKTAIGQMASEFVLGQNIEGALKRASKENLTCSFDMLGEGARTVFDADKFENDYANAIRKVGEHAGKNKQQGHQRHNISVKLSALGCQYKAVKEQRVFNELYPKLERLMLLAAEADIDFYVDAEESDRLVLSLKLLERLELNAPKQWNGLGLAIQAYQKRALNVVSKVIKFAQTRDRKLRIRLVKGAYWDTEVRSAQLAGLPTYPVFTNKIATDAAYIACAKLMLESRDLIYPAFATHNAHTIAAIRLLAQGGTGPFEYQRLHGMGQEVYDDIEGIVRVYAPVGKTEDLLPYLVRRLLENGANNSFVNQFRSELVTVDSLVEDPVMKLRETVSKSSTTISMVPNPKQIFKPNRVNSIGIDLTVAKNHHAILSACDKLQEKPLDLPRASKASKFNGRKKEIITSPSNGAKIGTIRNSDISELDDVYNIAVSSQRKWNSTGFDSRADILLKVADSLEKQMVRFVALIVTEAGRTLEDAVYEVREAVDFCRYYAAQARLLGRSRECVSPTGEINKLHHRGRGVIICISPWNFPLAIFIGQVSAALVSGNSVIAKPAPQTPNIAFEAVKLLYESGVPEENLQLVFGGSDIGKSLVEDTRHDGVVFTGSFEVGRLINISLANRIGAMGKLIAETSGLNAIIADSTALPEQLIDDTLLSAFGSAGQRCSSARLLLIPEETSNIFIERLVDAMSNLDIGNPALPSTDVGPLIDGSSKSLVDAHVLKMKKAGYVVHQASLPSELTEGSFVPPTIIEIPNLDVIDTEVFGPVLHVLSYKKKDALIQLDKLSQKGFALTLGIHSRLEIFVESVKQACPVGNFYINRSITGAAVEVQPFGGFGLSGTGPKAGGPSYLNAFVNEVTVSEDLTAKGGDLDLINSTG